MTVSTSGNIIVYQGNGSTTNWVFSFAYVDAATIQVFKTSILGTVELSPSQYDIVLNPPIGPNPTGIGGTVIFPLSGPPLAVGEQITIQRSLPAVQNVSLSNQSIIYPPVIEREFDYLTMLGQQGTNVIDRSFKVGPEDPIPAVVPPVALRKNQQAFFDNDGNLFGGAFTGPSVVVSAAMQPVVAAATIPAAQVLLGTQAMIDASLATVFTTGDLKPTHKTVADAGWIMWSDGTIGDDTSGASILQSTLTAGALFALYYNSYSDAICPLFTSTGTLTNRGAQGTAAVAFANHCRMSLPRGAGRSLGVAGLGAGLTNRPLGSTVGIETITQTIAQMPFHYHDFFGFYTPNYLVPLFLSAAGTDYYGIYQFNTITNAAGGSQPMNIMQPTSYVNVMVKL